MIPGGGTTAANEPEDLSNFDWSDAAEITSSTTPDIKSRIRDAAAGSTVKIKLTDAQKDFNLGNQEWIKPNAENVNVYIDLNGHTLKLGNSYFVTNTGGSFNFYDSSSANGTPTGKIDATADNANDKVFGVVGNSSLFLDHVVVNTKKRVIADDTSSDVRANITIRNSTFTHTGDGTDVDNGGAVNVNNKDLTVSDTTISGYHVSGNGGAIWADNSEIKINNSTISTNTADNVGGAIYSEGNSGYKITMNSGTISNNSAKAGGGIYAKGNGYTFTMNGGTISDNTASDSNGANGGGGVRLAGGTSDSPSHFVMNGGTFRNNRSNAGGGGIKVGNYDNDYIIADFHNGTFGGEEDGQGNTSHGEGGAISLGNSVYGYIGPRENSNDQLNISHNKVDDYRSDYGKTSDWGGGGVFVADGATLKIQKAVIENNSAVGFGGGVAGCSTGRIVINSNKDKGIAIFENTAEGDLKNGLSGGTSAKHDDHVIADGNTVFLNNGYKDYFCALDSSVNEEMLGGGSENWTGSYDSKPIEKHTKPTTITATQIMGLTSQVKANDTDADSARAAAKVNITWNSSGTHGGGILCNGIMIMGESPDSLTFNDRLIVSGLKSLENENYNPDHPFTFRLVDSEYNEVATKNTTLYNADNAKNISNIASFQNKGIIEITIPYSDIKDTDFNADGNVKPRTYYLYEVNNSLEYATNTTAYEIDITGKQYKNSDENVIDVKFNDGNGDNAIPSMAWTANQIYNVSVKVGTFVDGKFKPGENDGNFDEHFAKKLDTGIEHEKDQYNHAKYLWLGINGVENGTDDKPLTDAKVNADIYTASNQDRKLLVTAQHRPRIIQLILPEA